MSPRLRGAAVLSLLLAVGFAAGATAGFVYGHDPRPDDVTVRLTESPPPPLLEGFVAGTVSSAGAEQIVVLTAAGEVTVELPAGTAVEELVPAAVIAIGTPVNLGGTVGGRGPVLTGVVAFEPERGSP